MMFQKKYSVLIPLLMSFFLITICQASGKRRCTIKQLVGSVKVRRGTSTKWINARPKMPLKESDALRTYMESEAELETSEGSVVKIGENTTIELAQLFGDKDKKSTKVKILNGAVLANVKKLVSTKSSFEFETPTATAAIRGTIVGFEVSKEQTKVKVYEGKVWVVPQGSKKGMEIQPNQMGVVKKGDKDVAVVKMDEKSPVTLSVTSTDTSEVNDSLPETATDSLLNDTITTSDTTDTSGQSSVVQEKRLRLSVTTPVEGQEFKKPLIPVSGSTTPGAELNVMSIKLPVTANGTFNGQIPIANEAGEYNLEFEASLEGMSQKISRRVTFKPDYRFILTSPADRQTVTTTLLTIKGEVLPANSEVSVLGRQLPVSSSGQFSGIITIPDEEGEVILEFEISAPGINKTEIRKINYKRPPDQIRPQISTSVSKSCWSVTVFDRTIDEEITLWSEIDGVSDSRTMRPNESTCLPFEEGVHSYSVYAEDLAKNVSSTEVLKNYAYLSGTSWLIRMRKPAGNMVIDLPPSSPAGEPAILPIELTIEKLPDDNMDLIHEVIITNKSNGKKVYVRTFTDNFISADMELVRNRVNVIQIDVRDINDVVKSQPIQVHVR